MITRSTSGSFVGVCLSWPNPSTTNEQVGVARKAKAEAKGTELNKKIETNTTNSSMIVAFEKFCAYLM